MWYRTHLKRLVIIIAIVVSISTISASALIQKYGTTLVIVPVIIGAIVAIAINIMYWQRKSHLELLDQRAITEIIEKIFGQFIQSDGDWTAPKSAIYLFDQIWSEPESLPLGEKYP